MWFQYGMHPLPYFERLVARFRKKYPETSELLFAVVLLGMIALTASVYTERVWLPAVRDGTILPAAYDTVVSAIGTEAGLYWISAGVGVGLLPVWLSDSLKQKQTIGPLVLVLAVVVTANVSPGAIFPGESSAPLSQLTVIALGLAAAALTVRICGIPIENIWGDGEVFDTEPPYEFPRAPYITFGLLGICVVVGIVDVHGHLLFDRLGTAQVGREEALFDVVLSGLILVLIYPFVLYTRQVRVVQLGPARSGKTTMFAGMYHRLDKENRAIRDETSAEVLNTLDNLHKNDSFPDRTKLADPNYIQLTYISGATIFKRKTRLSSVDHSGEILTGGPNKRSLADRLDEASTASGRPTRVSRQSLIARLTGSMSKLVRIFVRRDRWTEAVREMETQDSIDDISSNLAQLVASADIVSFTLPLNDFLQSHIERAEKDESLVQEYAEILMFEPAEDGDGRYNVRTLRSPRASQDETTVDTVYEENGGIYYEAGGSDERDELDIGVESVTDLPKLDDGRHYWVKGSPTRESVDSYTDVYNSIVRSLEGDSDSSFMWIVTMADYATKEFETLTREELKSDIEIRPSVGAAIDQSNDDGPMTYRSFARWVLGEYINQEYGNLDDEFDRRDRLYRTNEEFLYPVWFDIEGINGGNANGFTINDASLRGTEYVTDRFDGYGMIERVVDRPTSADENTASERNYNSLADAVSEVSGGSSTE